MKYRNITNIVLSALMSLLLFSCARVEEPDYRETDYGYVQFKIYKEASYTKADGDKVLQFLAEATKIKVNLTDGKNPISQALVLHSSDAESAEYGLRSDKMKLLAGEYRITSYALYGKMDELIYDSTPSSSPLMSSEFQIVPGGLCVHDLLANTVERGKVKFTLVKDFVADTKADASRKYTFDEIKSVDIALRNSQNRQFVFKALPVKFSLKFAEDADKSKYENGYQTSVSVCDSTLSILAGEYTVDYYVTYDDVKGKSLLERNDNVRLAGETVKLTVKDNETTDAEVPVRLDESDEYLKDYYALKVIWESLDGPNWYYSGEDYATGVNWNFDKDLDLWGDQPGVSLHSNGRVALINVSDFGFRGTLPAEIAQFTELTELYLGTHNDANQNEFDETLNPGTANRFERHKAYLSGKYVPEQMSEPIARALKEHNISIPSISKYETMIEEQLFDKVTGRSLLPQLKDAAVGKLYNGLTAIDPAIWTLDKLERLTVANGLLKEFPKKPDYITDKDKGFAALTDLEIYNCGELRNPKDALKDMPALISVNLSQNNQEWSSEEANALLNSFANGKSARKIQILYMNKANLTKVNGNELRKMTSLGLLDLSDNKITEVSAFGPEINLVQLHLNNNQITSLSRGENGEAFCGMADVETFSVRNNKIRQFPDIFDAKSLYGMASVDFSYNDIANFEGYDDDGKKTSGSKGIYVETLTLANNPIKVFPDYFKETDSKIAYINMRGCQLETFRDSCFCYPNSVYLTSFDFSYNRLKDLPKDFHAGNIPYLYGLDVSYNAFSVFPFEQFDMAGLTVFAIRGQRDDNGERCLTEWPTGVYNHVGLRGLYLGSNDIRTVNDRISTLCYYLDISDNPNIVFDATDVCYEWQVGMYYLIYDKTQTILNCDLMLQ